MKSKLAIRKYIKSAAVFILAIAGLLLTPVHNTVADNASVSKPIGEPVEEPAVVAAADEEQDSTAAESVINIYSCDPEAEDIFAEYYRQNPGFRYKFTCISDGNGTYFRQIISELEKGGGNTIDIYCVPGSYAGEFIKGDYNGYACTYKELGIDVDAALKKADIPRYAIDAGTNPDGELVTLPYEPDVGVFMYRRSIAREVWGTDDPGKIAGILGAATEKWDRFMEAAKILKRHGYSIVPGCDDIWPLVDARLKEYPEVNSEWLKFMDISKELLDKGCMTDILQHTDEWYNYLQGKDGKRVFGLVPRRFFEWGGELGETYGDWAICLPPVGNIDLTNSTAILINKDSPLKDKIRPLVEWITLDCSETGLQRCLANDSLSHKNNVYYGLKRPVVSGTVLKAENACIDFLGGQDVNTVFYDAQKAAAGKQQGYNGLENIGSSQWLIETKAYLRGEVDRKTAIADYLKAAKESREYFKAYYYDPAVDTAFNIYTEDQELVKIVEKYAESHPEFKYKIHGNIGSTISDNHFLTRIIEPLEKGDGSAIDIYSVPAVYAEEFIKGKYAGYASTYKELGIDVNSALKKADIPQYAIDAGTNPNGEVIALPYESDVCVFMYRRSIARRVWGTDDPDKIADIIGAGTENFEKFKEAAQTLKKHDCYIMPGSYGLWPLFEDETDASGWGLNENSDISPKSEEFMDISKYLFDNGCMKDTDPYSEQWYKELDGKGDKQVFGFVTFDKLITIQSFYYQSSLKNSAGDWAVCLPPSNKSSTGVSSGIMVNKASLLKDKIGPLIEWITLDCSENGLQYRLANGTLYRNDNNTDELYKAFEGKRSVISGTIMKNTKSCMDFLGGQNMNPVICDARKAIDSKKYRFYTSLDSAFAGEWFFVTREYLKGEKNREDAIAGYKARMKDIRKSQIEYMNAIYGE